MTKDKIKNLYDTFVADGYEMESEAEFRNNLSDAKKRKAAYEALVADGYEMEPFDAFENNIGYGKAQPTVTAEQPTPVETHPSPGVQPHTPPVEPTPADIAATMHADALNHASRQADATLTRAKDELEKEYKAHYAREAETREKMHPILRFFTQSAELIRGARTGVMAQPADVNKEIRNLHAAADKAEDAQKVVEEAKKKGNTNFIAGAGRGLRDKAFELSNWDFGMTDLRNNLTFTQAIEKQAAGEALTSGEELLLESAALNQMVNENFYEDLGRGYKAGAVTAESLPFMLETAMNPASSLGKTTASATMKALVKKYGTEGAKNLMGKVALAGGRIAGDVAGASIMSATTSSMRVLADAQERYNGQVDYGIDENGYIRFNDMVGQEAYGSALLKAYGANAIEHYSEMVGESFGALGAMAGGALAKGATAIGLGKVTRLLDNIKASDWAKTISEFERRTQWNGVTGEWMEENVGTALNAVIVGDSKLSDLLDADQQIDTFLGVSLMGGAISTLKTFGYGNKRLKLQKQVDAADRVGGELFGDRWEDTRESFDMADAEGKKEIVAAILDNPEYGSEKKQAFIDYARAKLLQTGANMGDAKRRTEGDVHPVQFVLEDAFERGYASTPEQRNELYKNMNKARRKLERKIKDPEVLEAIERETNPAEVLSKMMADAEQSDVEIVADYYNAKAAYEGVINRVQNDIEDKENQARKFITQCTNADGNIYDVEMKMGERVYVVGDSAPVFDENGFVDKAKSPERVLVRDASGKLSMRPTSEIGKLHFANTAESVLNTTLEDIRQGEAQKAANDIEGVREFELSETVTVMTENGVKEVVVGEITPDGEYMVYSADDTPLTKDGVVIVLSARELSMMEAGAKESIEEEAEVQAEPVQAPTEPETPVGTEQQPQPPIPPVEATPEQPEANKVLPSIPTDEKGTPLYHRAPVELTVEDLNDGQMNDAEVDEFVANLKAEATKNLNKQQKAAPKVGTNKAKYLADKRAWEERVADARAQVDYWDAVQTQITEMRRKPGDEVAEEILQMGEPMDGHELAALLLGHGNIKLLYDSYLKETGASHAEARGMLGIFATREGGGLSVEEAGEKLMLADQEDRTNFFDPADGNAGRNAIIEVLTRNRTRGELLKYIENNRRQAALREQEAERAAYEHTLMQHTGMSIEEFEAYEESISALLAEKYKDITDDDLNTIFADINQQQQHEGNSTNEQGRVSELQPRGTELRSREGTDNQTASAQRTGQPQGNATTLDPSNSGIQSVLEEEGTGGIAQSAGSIEGKAKTDSQGNLIDEGGNLIIEKVESIDEITDEDFTSPTRNVQLPTIPQKVDAALGAKGKPVIIKKNIFEKNKKSHKDLSPNDSRKILYEVFFETNLYGQNQKTTRPYNWILIHLADINAAVIVEVNENKDNVEVVNWHYLRGESLKQKERQAIEEGGLILALESAAGNTLNGLSFTGKDSNLQAETQANQTISEPQEENTPAPIARNEGENILDFAERVAQNHEIRRQEAKVNTNPSEAQKEAGNYRKGHIKLHGFDITIEQPKGSVRQGVDENGKAWSQEMQHTYGYIRGTTGKDNDHIDVFIGDNPKSRKVFVVDQVNADSKFDEHKVMLGFDSAEAAREAYMSNYEEGWQGFGGITETDVESLRKWAEADGKRVKAFAEYKENSAAEQQSTGAEQAQDEKHNLSNFKVGDVVLDYYTRKLYRIKRHASNGMSHIAELDASGNELGITSLNAHNNPRFSLAETTPGGNRLVSDERYAELRERMRKKLGGQMNLGIDPEILAIGTEMAVYHLEKGSRAFARYAKAMIEDLGDAIRPYLKAFYNGARDLPEIMDSDLAAELTPYDEVRSFDVTNFDKPGKDIIAMAETIAREAEVEKQAETAKAEIKAKRKKSKKKNISSQVESADLFGGLFDEESITPKSKEDGLQGNDGVRSGRLSADGGRHEQGLSREAGRDSESQEEESRRLDSRRKGTSESADRSVRPGLSDSVENPAPLKEPKNTNNNHSERGANHAPTSADARIDANIKAIEIARQLIENGEKATPEQMAELRRFSGWGGLGKAFSNNTHSLRIQQLLGAEGYKQAVMSANSAYYTPAYVVDTLWDIAEQMGFKGGNILEGSAGIGNILGQIPAHINEQSDIHAVEIDGTSGGILSLLYPDAKVEIQGFEQTRIPNGSVDLAITNVPFVTGLRVNDTTGDKDLSKKFHNIHDFCIAKNVRKLREGGIGIFISSNGTLDNSKKLRDWIVSEGGSDFVGAFRMNNKTFGGTGVTSDIIVIRKRVNGRKSANAIDVSSISGERMAEYDTGETRKVKGREVPIVKQLAMDYNRYFMEHPENMAGEMRFAFEQGDTFRPTSKGLYPAQDKNQEKMLAEFVESFKEEKFAEKTTTNASVAEAMPGKKIGEMFVKDGKLHINLSASAQPLEVNANKVKGHTKVECFNAYAAIKDALADVLSYQTENESNDGLQPLLDKLNRAYDDFVKTYGHFNKNTAIAFLRNDVDYPNVFSLEKYEETGDKQGNRIQTFEKTDVFSQRVIEKEKEPTPTNVKDGIVASVFKFGRIDAPYIAAQLGKSVEAIRQEILEAGLGFEDPATRRLELSYQYLSGNVREKLRQAQANNEGGLYDSNIKALQEVIPMNIPAHLIDFTLGSSWIAPKLYNDYVKERTDIEVTFTAAGGSWYMAAPDWGLYNEKNRSMGVYSELLRKSIMGHTLIEAAIQNKTITVSQTRKQYDGSTETITDKDATQACAAKIDEIRQDFKEWARGRMQSDSEMSERMERIYNDTFNNYVPVSIPDEFVPEYFGGASHKFKMRPHQSKSIVRGTMQPLLLAHEVGTGKTFTLISTAMEMRRLGTARKPMIVVQNATVGQFVASAKELYPNAKILTLEESDRNADGRMNFYAKIRYNDWDMIVVPQSTFEFIPDGEERQMVFIQDKIEEKMLVLEQMKEADPTGKSIITRQAEKEIEQLQEQLAGLSDEASKKRTAAHEKKRAVSLQNAEVKAQEMLDRRTDDVENFDDMGIDALLIDEAHEYKHLGFVTAMQRGVKGVDPSYSKKSQGVYLKAQAVLEKNNGRNVIFATGTPISNTAAEIWTFMRYLMPAHTMKEYGIYYFDDFVRNFGNIQQMLEFTTSGKFKENNRFAGYVNLPELVRIWSGVSDTVLTKEAGGVRDKIPELEDGKAQDLYLPQTRALRSIMKYVKAQLEDYEKMSGKQKKENSHIPLTMYGIAKAAAVDARLVDAQAEDDANSKTNEAVRQTLRSLKEAAAYKGTVAIFADNYQNKHSGFNLYEDIRAKLIAEGVSAEEIVVMKSGMTVKKKLEIFDKVNRGEVRVVLGSTFTLGTGVNIQERLHTLIHLDAPNRPMDYTQRNGRILRQGNLHKVMNKPVRVLRFGVEDSLDVTAYQRLKTKGAIADSIMNGKQMMANSMSNRVLEEEEDVFGDTVAQLSGSEYAMLKNNAEKNVRKFESRKKQWEADQTYIHNAKPRLNGQIAQAEQRIEQQNKRLQTVRKAFPGGTFKEITAGEQTFHATAHMADFIKSHNKSILDEVKKLKDGGVMASQTRKLSISFNGMPFEIKTVLSKEMSRSGGQLFSEVHRKMTYSCPELELEDVPVHQSLLRNAIEDITTNVITGKDFVEAAEAAERSIKHQRLELEQLQAREGKPFEFDKELEQAKLQYAEYTELMKTEMQEKEAKYAQMDSTIDEASNLSGIEEEDDVLYRAESADELDAVNERFNEELQQQIAGTLEKGHTYELGMPSGVLLSTGISYKPILLRADRLLEKATSFGHDFDLSEVKDLPKAISNPIAIFEYGDRRKSQNLITETENNNGKKFIVGISITPTVKGVVLDINSVRNVFPKDTHEWIYWVLQNKGLYYDKKRLLSFLDQQRTIPADVAFGLPENQAQQENLEAATKVIENFENPSIADDISTREGTGTYTDDEVSYENDPSSKLLGRPRGTAKQRKEFARRERERMVQRVQALCEKLHLDNVEIVTDAGTLKGEKAKAKGFYEKSTGKITIVIPNNSSTADAQQTLLHEAVAHHGLRKLFGEHFKTFLDNVYKHADKSVREEIAKLALRYGGDFHKATEEYLASLAERTNFEEAHKTSWWQKIKDLFLDMLHRVGFEDFGGVTLTDNELRYILWRSYENLREPGGRRSILGEAADVARQHELKVGNYAASNSNSQIVADDTLFRDGDPEIHERALARDRYEHRVKSGMYQTQEALQDSMLGLREAMEAILGKDTPIEEVEGFENAYLGENRLSSVNKAEADAFAQTLFKPMLDEVAKLAQSKAEREELTNYMMAKHGLERNLLMADRAYAEYAQQYPNGTKTLQDFREQDYAGLTALTDMEEVADAEAEARQMVSDYEQTRDTAELWKRVNAVSKAILQKSYECGMMDKKTFDKISTMYEYYIPLRGFDEKTSADAYAYLTHKQSAFNAPIKTAGGRKSKADDPFAYLQSMAESAIMQGNRNKLVKQRFLNFVLNHPSDLVSVSDLWLEYDVVADEWKPVFPDNIDSSDTPAEVEQKMLDFEQKMQGLARQHRGRYKRGRDAENIPYRVVESKDLRQHQVVVKRAGRDYVITINGSPRAAQALNGHTNPDNDQSGAIGAILRAGEAVNRQLSAFYTTRNPDFIVSNFMRDMLYTNSMVWIKESPNYALRFHRNVGKVNPVKMRQLLAKHRKGELDMSNTTEAMFRQFMMNGGETGYANMRDIEQRKNDIRKELKQANGKLGLRRALGLLGERFDELNRATENCARFAAFMTSRQMGRTIDRAIYDAKEISVNFNKKGSGAKFFDAAGQTTSGKTAAFASGLGRSGFVFWNAAIQGTTNFGRQFKRHPAKAFTGAAALFMLGALVASLGADDDDDDKNAYYNLPEYVRRSNILFSIGNHWVSIPLPIEYRALYGMGELMTSALSGKEHLTGEEVAEAIAGQVTQILPIDVLEGSGGLSAFVPSALKPFSEAYIAEKSWTGMPLYKDTPYNKNMPQWTKAYKGANKYIVGLCSVLNEATGGNPYTQGGVDINPAKIEYMLNGYFGGASSTIDKLTKTVETIAGRREYDPRSFLLWNRLVKAGDERTEYRAVNNEYFRLKNEHDNLKSRLKRYESDTDNDIFDYAEKIDFLYNSPDYERYEIFEDYRKDIDALYEELKEAPTDEERRDIEAELNELKKELVNEANGTRKRK